MILTPIATSDLQSLPVSGDGRRDAFGGERCPGHAQRQAVQGLCALLPESPCEDLKQEVRHAIPAITTTKAPFLSLLIGGQFAQWKLQVIEGLLPPGNWKE